MAACVPADGILYWTPLILDGILTGNFNKKVITGQHGEPLHPSPAAAAQCRMLSPSSPWCHAASMTCPMTALHHNDFACVPQVASMIFNHAIPTLLACQPARGCPWQGTVNFVSRDTRTGLSLS